jgi:5-methylcytosine-specific restriction endonuclease McrA
MATKIWLLKHREHCTDCHKMISYRSKRCYTCENKRKHLLGLTGYKGIFSKILIKKLLKKLYIKENKNIKEIAVQVGCGKSTVANYLEKYNILKCRWTRNTWKKRMTGKNHPNYIHGKGYAPYTIDFINSLKDKIRIRDKHICQNCNMTEKEHLVTFNTVLHVHHIDYNKNNCKENNLITLCRQCNIRANYNRTYWIELYKNKLMERI